MFEGIGRIGAYAAQQNMRLEAKYKLKTGQSLKDIKEQLREALRESLGTQQTQKSSSMSDSTKISIIRQKLRQGRKLSANELKYLKETDESLYDKAKKTENAREELQQALKRAKSKDEARRAVLQAQMKVAAEAQLDAKGGGVNIGGAFGGGGGEAASFGSHNISGTIEAGNTGEGGGNAPDNPNGETVNAAADNAATATKDNPATDNATPAAQDNPRDTSTNTTTSNDKAKEEKSNQAPQDKNAPSIKVSPEGSNFDGEIPGEKYLFMLAAIQDEWRRFIHTKDYEELPERDIDVYNDEAQTKSNKPAYKKALDEDMTILYRTQPQDLLPGDLLDLRAKI